MAGTYASVRAIAADDDNLTPSRAARGAAQAALWCPHAARAVLTDCIMRAEAASTPPVAES